MATLFRCGDGAPIYHTAREVVYDAAGQARFYIVNNETVLHCADSSMAYWISGNYLFRQGGYPAFYFDEVERKEELVRLAAEDEIDQTIGKVFPELG
jgi:hypothetical protein